MVIANAFALLAGVLPLPLGQPVPSAPPAISANSFDVSDCDCGGADKYRNCFVVTLLVYNEKNYLDRAEFYVRYEISNGVTQDSEHFFTRTVAENWQKANCK
jgi:hypothetical protein